MGQSATRNRDWSARSGLKPSLISTSFTTKTTPRFWGITIFVVIQGGGGRGHGVSPQTGVFAGSIAMFHNAVSTLSFMRIACGFRYTNTCLSIPIYRATCVDTCYCVLCIHTCVSMGTFVCPLCEIGAPPPSEEGKRKVKQLPLLSQCCLLCCALSLCIFVTVW